MLRIIFKIILVSLLFLTNSFASDAAKVLKWNSKEGLERLENSNHKNDFYDLVNYFQPQINPLYCSVASSVIILNAFAKNGGAPSQKDLEVAKPEILGGGNNEFNSYSQITFLDDKTDKIKDRKIINLQNINSATEKLAENFDPGLKLAELKEILVRVYNLKLELKYVDTVDKKSINEFRDLVKEVVSDNNKYLLINFDGKFLGLKTNGHISPLVAFDSESDSVLVMDVAGHKNGWYWAKISDVFKAMHTKDGENYRGYLIISK